MIVYISFTENGLGKFDSRTWNYKQKFNKANKNNWLQQRI